MSRRQPVRWAWWATLTLATGVVSLALPMTRRLRSPVMRWWVNRVLWWVYRQQPLQHG